MNHYLIYENIFVLERMSWQQYIVIKFSLDIEKLLWAHSEFPGVGSNIGLLAFVIDWV